MVVVVVLVGRRYSGQRPFEIELYVAQLYRIQVLLANRELNERFGKDQRTRILKRLGAIDYHLEGTTNT